MSKIQNRDAQIDPRDDAMLDAIEEWDALSDEEKEERRESNDEAWHKMMRDEAPQ